MADPQTVNLGLYIPTRGSDVGVWDLPVNANESAIDSLFTNTATISLSNSNVTLTTPPNSGASWSGPYQSQSALLKFTGALTANCVATFPRPGFYIVWNLCTSGGIGAGTQSTTNYVQLTTGAVGGKNIGVPYGKKCHVYSDGTDMDFVNMADPGSAYDLHGVVALPSWMTACTVLPYVIKDGTVYSNGTYPGLASYLGNQFGGTPGISFAVPDELARARVGYDTVGTNRLTTAISGVNGQTMGSSGGNQSMQQHSHANTLNDPGHSHTASVPYSTNNQAYSGGGSLLFGTGPSTLTTSTSKTNIVLTNANTGNGGSQNVQPSIVSFLPLIKT